MAKRTSSLLRNFYKTLLLGTLGVLAFVLKLNNDTPTAEPFEQVHAEYGPYPDGGPDGGPGPGPGGDGPGGGDCPGPGPGDCPY